MRILYLTYDGLSDPLGQSQILPYLTGLADEGNDITIVSFEKRGTLQSVYATLKKKLNEHHIKWEIQNYTKHPPVLSTLYDVYRLKILCRQLHRQNQFQLVHCRSYITSLAGLQLKNKYGIKFVFDMRGFYADERAESGLWDQHKAIYRNVFRFFKKKEKEFLASADKVIVLTNAAKSVLVKLFKLNASKINVIPCCVDTQLFNPETIDLHIQADWKTKLAIRETDFVLSYLGAIGTWYLLDEMLDFYNRLLAVYPNAKFLFITHHPAEEIIRSASKKNISRENIIVVKAQRNEVPFLLSLSQLSIFFISPTFSKTASSPTKLAELFAMGIPVVCNTGIGDLKEITEQSQAGLIVEKFTSDDFDLAIKKIPLLLKINKNEIRKFAMHFFSLTAGIADYNNIYRETELSNKPA